MPRSWFAAALSLAVALASEPAQACMIDAEINLDDIRFADVVVVGQIANYKIIQDQEMRKEFGDRPGGFMSDYARFDVLVEETLAGHAPKTITVTWDNSTFDESDSIPPGRYLIALRDPTSKIPPLRGPSATMLPNREPNALTVLQAPCSSPFMFEDGSREAAAIRKTLAARQK